MTPEHVAVWRASRAQHPDSGVPPWTRAAMAKLVPRWLDRVLAPTGQVLPGLCGSERVLGEGQRCPFDRVCRNRDERPRVPQSCGDFSLDPGVALSDLIPAGTLVGGTVAFLVELCVHTTCMHMVFRTGQVDGLQNSFPQSALPSLMGCT